jgi:hypothetical protein
MGIGGLWPLIKKKGYDPVVRYQSTEPSFAYKYRVDILGTFFPIIRNAYLFHSRATAHTILEREIEKLGNRSNLVLYVDGSPCIEKIYTLLHREDLRSKSLNQAQKHIDDLHSRIESGLRVRNQHFRNINKHLRKSFYWNLDARQDFIKFMSNKNWSIVACSTEADLSIAQDYVSGDIVISKDSDMLIYEKIQTIYRPISKGRFLVYEMQYVLIALGLNRAQLTILGIVSKNDYNSNIPTMGPVTNYGVVKLLDGEGM